MRSLRRNARLTPELEKEIKGAISFADLDKVDPVIWGRVYDVEPSVIEAAVRAARADEREEKPHDAQLAPISDAETPWEHALALLRRAYAETALGEPMIEYRADDNVLTSKGGRSLGERDVIRLIRSAVKTPDRVFFDETEWDDWDSSREHPYHRDGGRRVFIYAVRSGDTVAFGVETQVSKGEGKGFAPLPPMFGRAIEGSSSEIGVYYDMTGTGFSSARWLPQPSREEVARWIFEVAPARRNVVLMPIDTAARIAASAFSWHEIFANDMDGFVQEFRRYTGKVPRLPISLFDYVDETGVPLFDLAGVKVISRFMRKGQGIPEREEREKRVLVKGQRYGDDYQRFRRRRRHGV